MEELKFKDDPKALEELGIISEKIQNFSNSHPNELTEKEHEELRELLNERAKALSNATGLQIHSICEDDED